MGHCAINRQRVRYLMVDVCHTELNLTMKIIGPYQEHNIVWNQMEMVVTMNHRTWPQQGSCELPKSLMVLRVQCFPSVAEDLHSREISIAVDLQSSFNMLDR